MGAFLPVELKAKGSKNPLDLRAGEWSMLAPHKVPTPTETGKAGVCLWLHGEPEATSRDGTAANHAMLPSS